MTYLKYAAGTTIKKIIKLRRVNKFEFFLKCGFVLCLQ